MFFKRKSKQVANVVIEDNVIRIMLSQGAELNDVMLLLERPLPSGLIEEGRIVDEIEFFAFLDELVNEFNLKKTNVRFYAPSALVVMRQVEIPEGIKDSELKSYFEMEIGVSLHLPFEEPLIDVYSLTKTETKGLDSAEFAEAAATTEESVAKMGILFAASGKEITRYMHIFEDLDMNPIAVDVQALGAYRYFYHMERPHDEQVHMFFELNMCSVNISVFYNHHLEFLRYQQLDLEPSDWTSKVNMEGQVNWRITPEKEEISKEIVNDQIEELSRIMNFYRYSQHQGQRAIKEIVVHGDYPQIEEVADRLQVTYELPVTTLTGWESDGQLGVRGTAFVPAFGLSLKGSVN